MKKSFKFFVQLQVSRFCKFALTVLLSLSVFSNVNATDYYVDNILGSNSNNGNSAGSAWSDFTNVNSRTFLPGDRIFLKSGCVWNSELRLKGSGNASNFIILDSYGTGNKPKIQRNSQVDDRTVFMDDVSYFKFRNMEICNAGDGIRLQYTVKGQTSVYFENLYIHNIDLVVNALPTTPGVFYSTGIVIFSSVPKPTSSNDYVATDIKITNCEIAFTTAPITFLHIFNNPSGSNTESPWSYKNILIDNNILRDFKGPISSRDMNNSLITNNLCKNGGTSALPQGTTGFFNWNLENVIFEGNVMDNIPDTGSNDQTWVDNEGYCNNVQLYGNLIKNTPGSGIEFLALGSGNPPRGTDDNNTNNVIDGNSFFNNTNGALKSVVFTGINPTGKAVNNSYQNGNAFFNGPSSGFTLSNNNVRLQTTTNLALYKSYIASSNYDNNQRASKAFDGSGASNWQAAGGNFANQWLRINFGSSVKFDKVVLSEFGNRTSGFRIEYSNDGITWQTASTGTTIGNSKTITFTAVTAKMARVYFTSGSDSPIVYEFEISDTSVIPSPINLASNKTYSSSSNWDASQTSEKGFDGNYSTNWQSANGTGFSNQWLQVNFGAATTFDKVILSEFGDRTTGYRIEYSTNGTTWQTAFTGTTIGTTKTITFSPVTGSYARILFTSGANTPIIFEFEVYKNPAVSSLNLALNRTYGSSSNYDSNQTPDKACDTNAGTNWQAGNGFNGQWLQVNFGASTTFNKVVLSEFGNRTTSYRIEYSTNGTTWQTAYTGTTIGSTTTVNFPAITGNYARVFFIGGVDTPIIYEFEIYNTASATRIASVGQLLNDGDVKYYFTISPNPSREMVSINYELFPSSISELFVYDMLGIATKKLQFTTSNTGVGKVDLDVSNLKSGVYIINISSDGKSLSKKLIVEK